MTPAAALPAQVSHTRLCSLPSTPAAPLRPHARDVCLPRAPAPRPRRRLEHALVALVVAFSIALGAFVAWLLSAR